jgi:hypothetical protein
MMMPSLLFVLLNKVRQALMALLKAGEGLLQNWTLKESFYSKGWVKFIGSGNLNTQFKELKKNFNNLCPKMEPEKNGWRIFLPDPTILQINYEVETLLCLECDQIKCRLEKHVLKKS